MLISIYIKQLIYVADKCRMQSCESASLASRGLATSGCTRMDQTPIECSSTSLGSVPDGCIKDEPDFVRELQKKLSVKKRESIKVKSRIRNCQLALEQQDEQIQALREKLAKIKAKQTNEAFNWSSVKAAHLVSKVFENCEPVDHRNTKSLLNSVATQTGNCAESRNTELKASSTNNILTKSIGENEDNPQNASKCLYTVEFHRFAIALYFFSPATYHFLSNLIPMFPHRNYIRQWVMAGRVEKLFPPGVYREEFNTQ